MCSAPYVFTKVLRQLVKYWRGRGHLTLMYLNDGLGGDTSFESAKSLSDTVRQDIVSSGFTPNDDKSVWQPTQKLVFLATLLDFELKVSVKENEVPTQKKGVRKFANVSY